MAGRAIDAAAARNGSAMTIHILFINVVKQYFITFVLFLFPRLLHTQRKLLIAIIVASFDGIV